MADSWKVAAVRAVLTATVVGLIAALTVWQTTDDVKAVVTTGALSFLSIIAARLGVEGTLDRPK